MYPKYPESMTLMQIPSVMPASQSSVDFLDDYASVFILSYCCAVPLIVSDFLWGSFSLLDCGHKIGLVVP